MNIQEMQRHLAEENIDGWLLYDFCNSNPLARDVLEINPSALTTRRFFYWIPSKGEPIQIMHVIEPHVLSHLPGKAYYFLTWQELEETLRRVLQHCKVVAMEYSPRNAIPYLSKVDGGTIELIQSFGVKVVSSGNFLQYYTCILDREQQKLHFEAADFLDRVVGQAWNKVRHTLQSGGSINEYQVRMFIADQMEIEGFTAEALPICAVNAHSADPHFEPTLTGSSQIKPGDFILIDLWCKRKTPNAIYGDITRVAVAAHKPTDKQQNIFSIVRKAQKAATDYVISKYAKGETLKGYEVDQVCRSLIEEKGYGPYFTHRTGHNIYTKDHGPGAHIDSLETLDLRELVPHTCFSIEPGIYLPGEFGVRLEYDIFLGENREVYITGGVEDELLCLL